MREFRVDLSQKGIDPRVKLGAHVALSHDAGRVGLLHRGRHPDGGALIDPINRRQTRSAG